jgi:hypothetical protein
MTFFEASEKAYCFLEKRQGIQISQFVPLLSNEYGETQDFWEKIVENLISENRIVYGAGCHCNSLKSPATLYFTDSYTQKCVIIN